MDVNESTANTESDLTGQYETDTLIISILIYFSLFVIFWLLFCSVRLLFPLIYNLRSYVDRIFTPLAEEQYGPFGWLCRLNAIPDDEFLDECGMDALCFGRVLFALFKISMVGVFNMIWLVPVYVTAGGEEPATMDYIVMATTTNVPAGSIRLIATTVSSYVLFGYAMYLILVEFRWFTAMRYDFLAKNISRNYTVYIGNIPDGYRSKDALLEYFRQAFTEKDVLEANVRLLIPEMADLIAARDRTFQNLEHAISEKHILGEAPTHTKDGEPVYSIDAYVEELREHNKAVKKRMQLLELSSKEDIQGLTKDGEPTEGGFVTFTSLKSKQAALQMNHYKAPFSMEAIEAPEPDDVIWSNVGKTHAEIQIGKLISFVATGAICLLWTIPIAFLASLSSVEGLTEQFPWLEDVINRFPWLGEVIKQLAPFLVVAVNALLPPILRTLSMIECPISGAVVETMLFSKLSAFMIIQTFIISALSGSIFANLQEVAQEPMNLVFALANNLPEKSTYFIQIVLAMVVVGLGLELLGVSRVVIAALRLYIGPNLSEKERSTTYLGLRPLADPPLFPHAAIWSNTVLLMIILFVYSSIAPIVNVFLAFAFLLMGSGYRHQFVYIYPPFKDSGGKLWLRLSAFMLIGIVLAEIILMGYLGLKEGVIAAPLVFPLFAVTLVFIVYIRQAHWQATQCLPSNMCDEIDKLNLEESFDNGLYFINDLYLQPDLQKGKRSLLPEELNTKMTMRLVDSAIAGGKKKLLDAIEEDTPSPLSDDSFDFLTFPVEVPCECTLNDLSEGSTKKMRVTVDNKDKYYTLRIQPGWKKGTRIKFQETETRDGRVFPPVTFVLDEEKHDVFERRGDDLIMRVVRKSNQRKSCRLKILLLDGEIWKSEIPKNSPIFRHGNSITIPGKGMPINGGPERGNIIVEFESDRTFVEV